MVEQCQKLRKYIEKLPPEIQQAAKNYNIKNFDELFAFLNARLGASKDEKFLQNTSTLVDLAKSLLEINQKFLDPKLKQLSQNTQKIDFSNVNQLNKAGAIWKKLALDLNYDFLDSFSNIGSFSKDNLRLFVAEMLNFLEAINFELAEFLSQNLSSKELKDSLNANPKSPLNPAFLQNALQNVQNKIKQEQILLSKFTGKIEETSDEILTSTKNITNQIEKTKTNFNPTSIDSFYNELKTNAKEIQKLNNEIKVFKKSLEIARQDELTKTFTRGAILEILGEKEEKFAQQKLDFCVCFVSVEGFEIAPAKYGRTSLDAILFNISKMLKKELETAFLLGRYSGSVFLGISNNKDTAKRATNALKLRLKQSKFIYAKEEIPIKMFCALEARSNFSNLDELLNSAYEKMKLNEL